MQKMPGIINITQAEVADLTDPQGALEKDLKNSHVPEIPGCHQAELIAFATGEMSPDILLPLRCVNGVRRRFRDVLVFQAKFEVPPNGRQFPTSGEAADALLTKREEVFTN